MAEEKLTGYRIGAKIRTLREEAGTAAAGLARAAGIEETRLAALERGDELPGLEELVRLAEALQVGAEYFLQLEPAERPAEVVRRSDRWRVEPRTEAARSRHFRYQALSYQLTDRLMAPYLIEIPPDREVEAEPSAHPGEEFLFVLEGELDSHVGGEAHHLGPGDALYFSSRKSHSLKAGGGQAVRLLACFAGVRRPRESHPLERAFEPGE